MIYKWQMMKSIRANIYCRKFVHGKCPLTGVASEQKQSQLVPGESCITIGNIRKLVVEWPFWVSVTIFLARWQVYLEFELTILKYIYKIFMRWVPFFLFLSSLFCFPTFSDDSEIHYCHWHQFNHDYHSAQPSTTATVQEIELNKQPSFTATRHHQHHHHSWKDATTW